MKLVSRVNSGEIKIPRFQRGFVWKKANVLSLLESILSGYPVGSLLFWRTEEKLRSERDIKGFQLPETQEKYPTNYVLDGQQRLTTIYGVLSWVGDATKPHILNVVYDLRGSRKKDESRFRHRTPSDGPSCLPLNILLDFSKFNAFQRELNALEDGAALSLEAERVNETFREYEIPIVTITERSLKEVCPIFERINSTGMRLTVYDLMVASTFHSEFDLNEEVEKITKAAAGANFVLDGVGVIRAAAALRGMSCKRSSLLSFKDMDPPDLRILLTSTKRSIEKAIDFLRAELGVVSGDFLPYEAQITILAKLCSLVPKFSVEQRRLITSWFWLSSFHQRYRGASDNILDSDIQNCQRLIDEGHSLVPYRKFSHTDLEAKEFRKGSAVSNAFVALLVTHRPRSIINGAFISIENTLGCGSFGTTGREIHGTTRSIGLRREREGSTACGMVALA